MAFFECPDCGVKLPYAGKPHACKAGKSSGGGVYLRTPMAPSGPAGGRPEKANLMVEARVATSPSETKSKKRAPAGTFDRNAYQREYMRTWRKKKSK